MIREMTMLRGHSTGAPSDLKGIQPFAPWVLRFYLLILLSGRSTTPCKMLKANIFKYNLEREALNCLRKNQSLLIHSGCNLLDILPKD